MQILSLLLVLVATALQTVAAGRSIRFSLGGIFGGKSKIYRKRFYTGAQIGYGYICFDLEKFCDAALPLVSNDAEIANVACLAAKTAVSYTHAYFGVNAVLVVREGPDGNVNRIRLNAKTAAGALAVAFSDAKSLAATETAVEVEADAKASKKILYGKVKSKARAWAGANAYSVAIAGASSTTASASGSESFVDATIFVRGEKLRRFQGFVVSYAAAYADAFSESSSGALSLSAAAADAYTRAIVKVWGYSIKDKDYDADFGAALAAAFSDAYAAAISKIQIYSYLFASVRDTKKGAKIFLGGNKAGYYSIGAYCAD